MRLTHLEGETFLPPDFSLPSAVPFTYAQARAEAGLTGRDLAWLVDRRFLRRVVKGVYVDIRVPDDLATRSAALKLIAPPDAVVCDRHAGWLHGAEMVLAPNEHLWVGPVRVFLPADRGRLRNSIADSGERAFRPGDIVEIDGLRVTSPLRTACDLGRQRFAERSLAAMDQMLRLGKFCGDELIAEVEHFRGMRWVTTFRALAPYADGRAESPPESVLRLRWIQAGLPEVTPQLEVWDDGTFLARLDLGNPDIRLGAEYDGAEWHSSPEQISHDRERRAAVIERAGYQIVTFRAADLFDRHANPERRLRDAARLARQHASSPWLRTA